MTNSKPKKKDVKNRLSKIFSDRGFDDFKLKPDVLQSFGNEGMSNKRFYQILRNEKQPTLDESVGLVNFLQLQSLDQLLENPAMLEKTSQTNNQ